MFHGVDDAVYPAEVFERELAYLQRHFTIVSLDTFIRVLMALSIEQNLETLLPDPSVRPIERIGMSGKERRRARPKRAEEEKAAWRWGDGEVDDD